MINIFKDKLFVLPEDPKKREKYPSPNDLKNKILIKAKGNFKKILDEINGHVQLQPE